MLTSLVILEMSGLSSRGEKAAFDSICGSPSVSKWSRSLTPISTLK